MDWEMMLDGHRFDLEDLPGYFDTDPRVRRDGDEYWVYSSTFDGQNDAVAVRDAASAVVARINGAMRLHRDGAQPVRVGDRCRNEDGETALVLAGTATARGKVGMVTVAGGTPGPRPPGPQEFAQLAAKDIAVADVLRILGQGVLDWYDLYKVFEIVRADVHGEAAIGQNGWATTNKIRAFRGSADHPGVSGYAARHARHPGPPPKNTMTLAEGRTFIVKLARSWVAWRLSGAGSPT